MIEISFSDEMWRVFQFAAEEADQVRSDQIGSEHLLLGLLRADQSVAASILAVGRLSLSTAQHETVGA